MHLLSQTDSPETAINVNKLPAFVPVVSNALSPAQQDTGAILDFTGKKAGSIKLDEPRSSPGQHVGQETECLLKRIASLESSNSALLNKLNFAQKEFDALRLTPAKILPIVESSAGLAQTYGWERKLTRTGWRPA